MLKALFLDLDDTLCDTAKANEQAKKIMANTAKSLFGDNFNATRFTEQYVIGIYRQWTPSQHKRYMPIIEQDSEAAFRKQLIQDLIAEQNIPPISDRLAQTIQDGFDTDRLNAFGFYPGIEHCLAQARKLFTLVVITNGPEFSQIPKVNQIKLADHVDHILIGGQEPEQKPATSIFNKALTLANCQPNEALHIGDSLTTDIAGANDSGIKSVWIQHQQTLEGAIKPDHILPYPTDIPHFIEELYHR